MEMRLPQEMSAHKVCVAEPPLHAAQIVRRSTGIRAPRLAVIVATASALVKPLLSTTAVVESTLNVTLSATVRTAKPVRSPTMGTVLPASQGTGSEGVSASATNV
jgi:hypothetical protein